MARYTYVAWDGSPDVTPISPEVILDALTQDLLQYGDLNWALSELLRRGYTSADGAQTLPGFDDLLRHLDQQKRAMLQRYAPDSLQLSPSQVAHVQQQVAALPTSPTDTQSDQDAMRAQVVAQLTTRQRRGAQRPPGQPWDVTEVLRQVQQYIEMALTQPEPTAVLSALSQYLERLQQLERHVHAYPFTGSQPFSVEEAERVLRTLRYLEELEQRLRWHGGQLQEVDGEALQELLGNERQQQFQQLQQLETQLQEAGLVQRTAEGIRLTPRGARQIGMAALREVFHVLRRGWRGQHAATRQGQPGALTGETRAYTFGDPFDVHLGQTLTNALARQARIPLRLHPHDFAMQCREPLTQSAAVIMLDMSYSMELFGRNRFTAAKKVALALAQLMSSLFPRDVLHIVGFGDTARHIPLRELPYVTVSREHTNTQDGLRLARTLLARQRAAHKHILLITDGRPTAVHLHGKLQLHTWGLHPVILEETYKEAKRCRDQAITLHTFMVADEAPLLQFVRRLTEVSQGRAFYTTPDRLGHYIIEDYLRRRSA